MGQQSEYLCGTNQYSPELLASVSGLLGNIHRLAQKTTTRFKGDKPLNTYVYSASTCGMLAAMVFEQYNRFRIRGFLDQKGSLLNSVSHDLGIFFDPPRAVFNLNTYCPSDIDMVICATAPAHYRTISRELKKKLPGIPVVFIHYSNEMPCITIQENASRKPILVATTGRCGTHWFKSMLRFLLAPFAYKEVIAATSLNGKRSIDHHIFTKMKPAQYTVDHFQLTPELRQGIRENTVNIIFLYRDPRDIQVSNSFYWNQHFTFNLETVLLKTREISAWRSLENIFLLRFEDLCTETVDCLKHLTEFLGISVPRNTLNKIARFNSFQYFSGGRSPGQNDDRHHYRKGIVGDWKNYYSRKHIQEIKTRCGQELVDIGYEVDSEW